MKKLLPLLLFCLSLQLHAQVTPATFPADSAQWVQQYYGYPDPLTTNPSDYFDSVYFYTMKGDTTIGSSSYKQLTEYILSIHMGLYSTAMPLSYVGALRFDGPTQNLYIVKPGTTTELLAYKFGVTVGSNYVTNFTAPNYSLIDSTIIWESDSSITFQPYPFGSSTFTRTVHLLYHQACGWDSPSGINHVIFRNIGSCYGFLTRFCPGESNEHILRSFSDLGAGDPYSFHLADIMTMVANQSIERNVQLYPNPATATCSVDLGKTPFHGPATIRIMNNLGALVYSGSTTENNVTLSLEHLATGIYQVEVTLEGHSHHNKLIKQ